MDLSLVIPSFNEAESLEELHREIVAALAPFPWSYEIIFVDDGSHDRTPDIIEAIQAGDERVRMLRLPRNLGKSAAYTAGFHAMRGDIVVTLDADLQDDPAEIPRMVERLRQGVELVVGWKQQRVRNEPGKALPSRVFNALIHLFFGLRLHDSNCGFRAMRREVAQALDLYGDFYRFIPELAHVRGFRVTELPVNHRKRRHGKSKYGPVRFWTGLLDLLAVRFVVSFRHKPLHMFGTLALAPFVLGSGLAAYVLIQKLLGDTFQSHMAALVTSVLLLLASLQILSVGLIGVMLTAATAHRPELSASSLEVQALRPRQRKVF